MLEQRLQRLCGRGPRRAARLRTCATVLALLLPVSAACAHTFTITATTAVLRADGTFLIEMIVDLDALALGVPSTTDSAETAAALSAMPPDEFAACTEQLRELVRRRVRVHFDDASVDEFDVSFPDFATDAAKLSPIPTVLGTTLRLSGAAPPGAQTFSFAASRAFVAVHLTIVDEIAGTRVEHMLGVGEESPSHSIGRPVSPPGRMAVVRQYAWLGFEHILPKGLDHILFVLGLFLLSTRLRPLLWQITAFTVAHTATLALSMLDVVSLPARVVEPLIALSIAYVAFENLATTELKPWRPALVFAFGLLHGLGFAGVLRELGLPPGEFATALLSFNVGVELGQLAVVAGALALVGWFRSRDWYRTAVVLPISAMIGLVGLYWAVERAMG